jgi:hypothetical protein
MVNAYYPIARSMPAESALRQGFMGWVHHISIVSLKNP